MVWFYMTERKRHLKRFDLLYEEEKQRLIHDVTIPYEALDEAHSSLLAALRKRLRMETKRKLRNMLLEYGEKFGRKRKYVEKL
jgi:hypothetical protein